MENMIKAMKFVGRNKIKLEGLTELDKLVFKFINLLQEHTSYVIVSGYVSILLGRSRSTEDVDIYINEMSKEKFSRLYGEIIKNGFWCLNSEDLEDAYSYLKDGLGLRFAEKGEYAPNFEVKFAIKGIDKESLKEFITVTTEIGDYKISTLERQIAFKKYYLASYKDVEDAKHLEDTFKNNIDYNKIEEYRKRIKNEKA